MTIFNTKSEKIELNCFSGKHRATGIFQIDKLALLYLMMTCTLCAMVVMLQIGSRQESSRVYDLSGMTS